MYLQEILLTYNWCQGETHRGKCRASGRNFLYNPKSMFMLSDQMKERSKLIKEEALRLGFDGCGISRATRLDEEADHLRPWLEGGMNGNMRYMARHTDKRTDPRLLVENAASVITVIINYYSDQRQKDPSAPVISKYIYGRDYHTVLKKKLRYLYDFMKRNIGPFRGRIFAGSAPVLEKAWAARSGLGWIGKNTLLITQNYGSFVFIGEIITDIDLANDTPLPDDCGNCTICLEACPTGALTAPKMLDARKCISYLTIENKGFIDESMKDKMGNRVFGCDACQDVCPMNRNIIPTRLPEFRPREQLLDLTADQWKRLDEDHFHDIFGQTAVARAGFERIKRNIDFLLND